MQVNNLESQLLSANAAVMAAHEKKQQESALSDQKLTQALSQIKAQDEKIAELERNLEKLKAEKTALNQDLRSTERAMAHAVSTVDLLCRSARVPR